MEQPVGVREEPDPVSVEAGVVQQTGRPRSVGGLANVRGSKQKNQKKINKNTSTELTPPATKLKSNSIKTWLTGSIDQYRNSVSPSSTAAAMPQTGDGAPNKVAPQIRATPTGVITSNCAPGPIQGSTNTASVQNNGGSGPHIDKANPPQPQPSSKPSSGGWRREPIQVRLLRPTLA